MFTRAFCDLLIMEKAPARTCGAQLLGVLGWGWVVMVSSCTPTSQQITPQLGAPPQLSSEERALQGKTITRPLALDPVRYDLSPETLAVLTNEVAADMGWKEHSILSEEQNGNYAVVMSEGTTLGVQQRVSIIPTAKGSTLLIFPPDEELSARIQEQVFAYLTGLSRSDADVSPQVQHVPYPFPLVWRAVKETLIDGGFSFRTADKAVGFIETEPVPSGKASRSWFRGVGRLSRVAQPPSMSYNYESVHWRYRIRVKPVTSHATEVSVEAVIEAAPDTSALRRLTSGTLDLLSVSFGSWIGSAATGDRAPRIMLPSRGRLEQEFFVGLERKWASKRRKEALQPRLQKNG